MKEVKRYEDEIYGPSNYDFEESEKGTWVKYTDHNEIVSALKAEREALAAENLALKEFGDTLNDMHNNLNGEGTGIQGRAEVACQQVALEAALEEFDAIQTPATNAYLNSVRAEGVEMAISNAFGDGIPVNRMQFIKRMSEFAANLRKGNGND